VAGQTPRFQFNFFGADTPGSFDDDDAKYSSDDRLQLDALLAALEKHDHRVGAALIDPAAEPDLLLSSDGALDAGITYYYCVSFVDANGLESVSGPEVSIDTPDLLLAPDAPAGETSSAGGALTPGLYYYALTGLRAAEESPLGQVEAVTVLQDEDTVTLTLPDLEDATSYQVWRQKSTDPGWTRIATSSTGSYVDAGAVAAGTYGDPDNIPPAANTGVGAYAITLTLAGADLAAVQDATSWRIYRSETSGAYSATSLVHEVIERTDDTDPTSDLLTSWLDDGDAPLTGSPKLYSTQLSIPPFTFQQAAPLPAAAGYPENYPILDGDGILYIKSAGAWTPIAGSGGGGGAGQVKGAWSQDVSESPGYLGGDVVTDAGRLWQGIGPLADTHPSDTPSPGTPWATITSTGTYIGGVGAQYAQGILASAANTLASLDIWNLAVSALPYDVQVWDSDPATGTLLASATVADPSALPVGWITVALNTPVAIANPSTHVITTYSTGNGVYDNVGTTSAETETGPISTFTGLSYGAGYTSSSSTRYLAMRLYAGAGTPAWTQLGRFIPTGAAAVFTGAGAPLPEPAGSVPGDLYIDSVTGDVYSLDGN
jgi:hypothetical protein